MGNNVAEPLADWDEASCRRAWEPRPKGWQQKDIAESLGVSKGAASRWLSKTRAGGVHFAPPQAPGGATKLTDQQRRHLPGLLAPVPADVGSPR